MWKRKFFLIGLVGALAILSTLSTVSASTDFSKSASAYGFGTFTEVHEGELHKHYFAFSVSDGEAKRNGWYYNPDGKFNLVCTHNGELCMIVKSDTIQRFKVFHVEGGLGVVFEGTATVKESAGWEEGWLFKVEAFDYNSRCVEDAIRITLTAPNGTQHQMQGTLSSGNIEIKK